MKKRFWLSAIAMILTMTLSLVGCAPSGGGTPEGTDDSRITTEPSDTTEDTQPSMEASEGDGSAPTTDTQPTDSDPNETVHEESGFVGSWSDPIGGITGGDAEAIQLRLHAMSGAWWAPFDDGTGNYYFTADSVDGLLSGLKARNIGTDGLDLEQFDEAFFRENRLAVIPRATNTGSTRYSYTLTSTGDGVKITLYGNAPENVTHDMADWLVLVPVPLAEYGAAVEITVDPSGASFTSNTVDK